MAATLAQGHEAESEAILRATFGCGEDLAAVMLRIARVLDYPARCAVVSEGDASDAVHFLTRGHARKQVISIEGRLVVIEDYRPGDIFGEGGLLGAATSCEEIQTVIASRAGAFANHEFVALMSAHADVALAVSKLLVTRLGNATRRLAEGVTLSAAGRIHAELLRSGRETPEGMLRISPAPVFSEFALLVQSTRETVSRTVNALVKRGIVRREEDALVIVAPHRLEELVY